MCYGFEFQASKEWLPGDDRRDAFEGKFIELVFSNTEVLDLDGRPVTLIVTSIFPDYNKKDFLLTQNNGNYRIDLTIKKADQKERKVTLAVTYASNSQLTLTLHAINPGPPKSLEEYQELSCFFSTIKSAFDVTAMADSLREKASELNISEPWNILGSAQKGDKHDLSRPINAFAKFLNEYVLVKNSLLKNKRAEYVDPDIQHPPSVYQFFVTYIKELTSQIISSGLNAWVNQVSKPNEKTTLNFSEKDLLLEYYLATSLRSELLASQFPKTKSSLTGDVPFQKRKEKEQLFISARNYIVGLMEKTAQILVPRLTQETQKFLYDALDTYRFEPPELPPTAASPKPGAGPSGAGGH